MVAEQPLKTMFLATIGVIRTRGRKVARNFQDHRVQKDSKYHSLGGSPTYVDCEGFLVGCHARYPSKRHGGPLRDFSEESHSVWHHRCSRVMGVWRTIRIVGEIQWLGFWKHKGRNVRKGDNLCRVHDLTHGYLPSHHDSGGRRWKALQEPLWRNGNLVGEVDSYHIGPTEERPFLTKVIVGSPHERAPGIGLRKGEIQGGQWPAWTEHESVRPAGPMHNVRIDISKAVADAVGASDQHRHGVVQVGVGFVAKVAVAASLLLRVGCRCPDIVTGRVDSGRIEQEGVLADRRDRVVPAGVVAPGSRVRDARE
mmetsp:Transcript_22177/g.46665  ORF Transcript_22177/g.46665 Transcript_22177/m.46665 type:complete len:311 (-) Transcript_22177:470-1402(-)